MADIIVSPPFRTQKCRADDHEWTGACFECCEACDRGTHICHFCGTGLNHDSTEGFGENRKRHYLSDCRPDLIDGSYYLKRGMALERHTDGPMV